MQISSNQPIVFKIMFKIVSSIGISIALYLSLSIRPLLAQDQQPALTLQDSTIESDFTTSLAWGDYDNDGDLDLMVGNGMFIADDMPIVRNFPALNSFLVKDDRRNRLYCNENGKLVGCWTTPENDFTTNVAWGDMDNDGNLDLAISNVKLGVKIFGLPVIGEAHSYLYRNLGKKSDGTPNFQRIELPPDTDSTLAMAWGDYDEDGKLDLALAKSNHYMVVDVINWSSPTYENEKLTNLIYHNDTDLSNQTVIPTFSLDPQFQAIPDVTFHVAWIDVDKDGDLDLSTANDGVNRIYCNQKHQTNHANFQPCWASTEITRTISQSWGDVDGNGYPDVAFGVSDLWAGAPKVVYYNYGPTSNGMLDLRKEWQSADEDATISVAWGDVDGDGDLDLVAGNGNFRANQQSRIYCNVQGRLQEDACWSSSQKDITMSAAWGDVDGDGLLDLAVGNISVPIGQQNRLYHNDGSKLESAFTVTNTLSSGFARSVAWGDMDGDHDLDLMVAGYGFEKLYCNDQGRLTLTSAFQSIDDNSTSAAWGDVDGDYDLDIVVGNVQGEPNRIYRNEGLTAPCQPKFQSVLEFATEDDTSSVAWGDMDGDGDLDLAVGNGGSNQFELPVGAISRIYRNEGLDTAGKPILKEVWKSTLSESTRSVAWGDVDQDGDLDLAVGNSAGSTRLYRNDGMLNPAAALFTLSWSSEQLDDTHSVAWADMDGDGDLDLAVGNTTQSSRVYCNDNGQLAKIDCWHSLEAERTRSIAWGDMDGDGDPDLAMGNQEGANYIYLNRNGMLTPNAVWSSQGALPGISRPNYTLSVAWGDVDGDGDLDLAAGNSDNQPSGIYRNYGRHTSDDTDNPPFVMLPRPGHTADAMFFSSAEIIPASEALFITYTLFANDSQRPIRIFPEYSVDGSRVWHSATAGISGDGLKGLHATNWPTGTTHLFVWNAAQDLIKSDQVVLRIRAQFDQMHSPILWPALGSESPPFRVAAPWYIHVVDGRGQPVANAQLYAGGDFVTQTNRAGLVGPLSLGRYTGEPLVALSLQQEKPSQRAMHQAGWSQRIYQTTFDWQSNSETRPISLMMNGEQRLTTTLQMPLILFNLVVSLDWPADITYTQNISVAMHKASDYLFDLSDGQMAFGEVMIYDSAQQWDSADIHISARNTIRPNSIINGIQSNNPSDVMQLGRAWNGKDSTSGDWGEQDGFRTISHEFGHYALSLYDEYFGYRTGPNDSLGGVIPKLSCTGHRKPENDAINASAMDSQYYSSELSDQKLSQLWDDQDCPLTAQWLRSFQDGHGHESAWDTLLRVYTDTTKPPRWQLVNPAMRGAIFTGPVDLPSALPDWPHITISSTGAAGRVLTLTVMGPTGVMPNVGVSLYKSNPAIVIDQGRTITGGRLEILGASNGDYLQASTSDGGLTGRIAVTDASILTLTLSSVANQLHTVNIAAALAAQTQSLPYLQIWPQVTHTASETIDLSFNVANFDPPTLEPSSLMLFMSDEEGSNTRFTQVNYSPSEDTYTGTLSLSSQVDGNQVQVVGTVHQKLYQLYASYQMYRIANNRGQTIFSNDGQLSLFINPHTFSGEESNLLITTNTTSPGAIPNGQHLVSAIYEVTGDSSATFFELPMAITLSFELTSLSEDETTDDLELYRWDVENQIWLPQSATIDPTHNTANALTETLGAFVIISKP